MLAADALRFADRGGQRFTKGGEPAIERITDATDRFGDGFANFLDRLFDAFETCRVDGFVYFANASGECRDIAVEVGEPFLRRRGTMPGERLQPLGDAVKCVLDGGHPFLDGDVRVGDGGPGCLYGVDGIAHLAADIVAQRSHDAAQREAYCVDSRYLAECSRAG